TGRAVRHGGDDDFLARQDGRDGGAELIDGPIISNRLFRHAARHAPPLRFSGPGGLADRGFVPVLAEADLGNLAVVEAERELARLGPVHDQLRLARVQTVGDVVLRLAGRVRALEVGHFLVDDDPLILAYL